MLAPGFADAVFDSQRVFRAVMDALARPGTVQALTGLPNPPAPLSPELAAIALTLADQDAALWLDAPLASSAEVADYLRFHTGAPLAANPAGAAIALVSDALRCPGLESFVQGTPAYPDRSATIVLAVRGFQGGARLTLEGPGIEHQAALAPHPAPADFAARLARNHAGFPLGVDHLLTGAGCVAGLPRSTRVR